MKKIIIASAALLFAHAASAQECTVGFKTAPDTRYILNDQGTAIDKKTGLQWSRCLLGQTWDGQSCTGDASMMDWDNALQAAQADEFAGHTDWRLPNVNELASLVEYGCYSPAINESVFNFSANNVYTSTPDFRKPTTADEAYTVNFILGRPSTQRTFAYANVRLVRTAER